MNRFTIPAVLAAMMLTGAAHAASGPPGKCFRSSEMRNHTIGGPSTLYVKVGLHDTYRLSMAGACLAGALPSDPLVIHSPPTSNLICSPLDLDLAVSKGGFATQCIVGAIDKLTPAQAAALPKKLRP